MNLSTLLSVVVLVSGEDLPMRAEPDVTSKVVATLEKNEPVRDLGRSHGDWCAIRARGVEGFVRCEGLDRSGESLYYRGDLTRPLPPGTLTVRPSMSPVSTLVLFHRHGPNIRAFRPNAQMSFGLGARYDGWGAQGAIGLNPQRDESVFVKSETLDLSVFRREERWGIDVHVQHYRGLFEQTIAGACDATHPDATSGQCRRFPDALSRRFGVTAYRTTHPGLALNSALDQDGWLIRSGGVPLMMMSVEYASAQLDDGDFELDAQLYTVTFGGGYVYGFNWGRLIEAADEIFTVAAFMFSGGPNYHRQPHTDGLNATLKGVAKISLGYNGERLFTGLTGSGDILGSVMNFNDALGWASAHGEVFLGVRF